MDMQYPMSVIFRTHFNLYINLVLSALVFSSFEIIQDYGY